MGPSAKTNVWYLNAGPRKWRAAAVVAIFMFDAGARKRSSSRANNVSFFSRETTRTLHSAFRSEGVFKRADRSSRSLSTS